MKRKLLILSLLLLPISMMSIFGQEDGSEAFNALRDAIAPSLPEGFMVNTGRTMDGHGRSDYRITYDENGEETNRLIYALSPNSKEFSEMDIAMGGETYIWKDRKVLFIDGSKTGMSVLSAILKNDGGKFSITHREFNTFKPLDKSGMEQMFETINFDLLENPN